MSRNSVVRFVMLGFMLFGAVVQASAAFNAYLQAEGQKQGKFKCESGDQKWQDWTPVVSVRYSVVSPRDAASGQTSGHRQHSPVRIVKEWGASSPQFLQALQTKETLTTVTVQALQTTPDGQTETKYTLRLTGAVVARIRDVKNAANPDGPKRQEISFTYQKLQVLDKTGKTVGEDDWE